MILSFRKLSSTAIYVLPQMSKNRNSFAGPSTRSNRQKSGRMLKQERHGGVECRCEAVRLKRESPLWGHPIMEQARITAIIRDGDVILEMAVIA